MPDIDVLSEEIVPVKLKTVPPGLTEKETLWPLTVPASGPTPPQVVFPEAEVVVGPCTLPASELLDCVRKPETDSWV